MKMNKEKMLLLVLLPAFAVWAGDLTVDHLTVNEDAIFNGAVVVNAPGGDIPMGIFTNKPPAPQWSSPTNIPGLVGWWDASQIEGLTDGQTITLWPDASPEGNDAYQADGFAGPTYKTGILNGKPVARFVPKQRLRIASSASLQFDGNSTIAFVAKTTGWDVMPRNLFAACTSWPYNGIILQCFPGAEELALIYPAAGIYTYTHFHGFVSNSWHYAVGRLKDGVQIARMDGALSDTINHGPSVHSGGDYTIGHALICPDDNPNFFWRGDIAEIVYVSGAISDADMASLEAYFIAKYNL